ncbi:TAP-like protein [Sinosporangium album]|uniref:TAP-like protein n=1 Tax=Sinosporangium album TaxID=504805 RepID=A0A1G8E259_9ACTN|nr:alpha/beta fold hydrolase [Sinosporangium album]SDH63931.1 TAP-like protein [Sinosporangium album]
MAVPYWRVGLALAALLGAFACGRATPPRQAPESLTWTPCRVTGQPVRECATVSVPVDWRFPRGPRIDMAVSRVPAADHDNRIGVLIYNPGGPETQGLYAPIALWPPEIAARFDIVGFDPRGVGQSNRVDCGRPGGAVAELAKLPSLTHAPDVAALDIAARTYVSECRQKIGSLAGELGSLPTARDVDEIRRLLGEEKVTLWMHSYGSIIGQAYIATYPNRVRAALLTGAVDTATPGVDYTLSSRAQPTHAPTGDVLNDVITSNLRHSLAGFAPWCETHPQECYTSKDPIGEAKAVAQIERVPAPGEEPAYRTLLEAAWAVSLDPANWSRFSFAVSEARVGRPEALRRLAAIGIPADIGSATSSPESTALLLGVYCADFAWGATVERVLNDYRTSGDELPQTPGVASQFVTCGAWPRPSPPLGALRGAGHVRPLIVNGEMDRYAPVPGAEAVARRFNASLLIVKKTGAQVVGGGIPCADAAATAYLVDGRPPETRTCSP